MLNNTKLKFDDVKVQCNLFAKHIRDNEKKLIDILIKYETYLVAKDEIDRTLDLLENIDLNKKYFSGNKVREIAVFLPSNQPLYAFFCFAVIPSLQAQKVNLRIPKQMIDFFSLMVEKLKIPNNIRLFQLEREPFLDIVTATKFDYDLNKKRPITDVVIFTGKEKNAQLVKQKFSKDVLFIFNGSGHNPVVVTETADVDLAVKSVLKLQLYNQGQDCAAPNSILIQKDIYNIFLKKLNAELKKVKVGHNIDFINSVGEISNINNFKDISDILIRNYKYISSKTNANIDYYTRIMRPVIIEKPLKDGGNYIESFAPIFFLQKYKNEEELKTYFHNERYLKNVMYLTVFSKDINFINSKLSTNSIEFKKKYGVIIFNNNLHAKGIERGIYEYGGYSKGASSLSINNFTIAMPTLPQRDIYNVLIKKDHKFIKKKEKNINNNHYKNTVNQNRLHWSEKYSKQILEKFSNKNIYVCATEANPSKPIDLNDFRNIIILCAVAKKLKESGKKVKVIFSWNDFGRFYKVPKGVNQKLKKYIGLPLSNIPNLNDGNMSYARYHEKVFEKFIKDMDIDLEYRYQTDMYKSGVYDDYIILALKKRKEIAKILLSSMTDKEKQHEGIIDEEYIENYYPISVYSKFTGKDNTKILDYNENKKITYKCIDSGEVEIIDITKDRIVKLTQQVDKAMKWKYENVVFESVRKINATIRKGDDVSTIILQKIYNMESPVYQVYQDYNSVSVDDFKRKISGSVNNSILPGELLKIYTPELLKWIYYQSDPSKKILLAFGSDIYRQYTEMDQRMQQYQTKTNLQELNSSEKTSLELSGIGQKDLKKSIPFRQAVSFGQIVQWQVNKLQKILDNMGFDYDKKSIITRLKKAKNWLEIYNRDKIIKLRNTKNIDFIKSMTEDEKKLVRRLRSKLKNIKDVDIKDLDKIVYGIIDKKTLDKKKIIKKQKEFFELVYGLLIGKKQGPRLSTFLWAIEDKSIILKLLNV